MRVGLEVQCTYLVVVPNSNVIWRQIRIVATSYKSNDVCRVEDLHNPNALSKTYAHTTIREYV